MATAKPRIKRPKKSIQAKAAKPASVNRFL